uniref:Uncharacterized protein n=1 Tax=Dulem virus 42 TaxID=3145760 RepID=A0AAU8B9R9_9CAUD
MDLERFLESRILQNRHRSMGIVIVALHHHTNDSVHYPFRYSIYFRHRNHRGFQIQHIGLLY